MKYIVIVADGMADYPVKELGERTPLDVARTPHMDFIAQNGSLGRAKTIPPKLNPASDVANISILGYDPREYYTGRGPLEAANLGVELELEDVAFRCNLITASGDTLLDYSAGHIKSKEAGTLIECIDQNLGTERIKFYSGVSYRHLAVVKGGAKEELDKVFCKAPHDIAGQAISKNLPEGPNAGVLIKLMENSRPILESQEINLIRVDLKENPANMIWLWGQGRKPAMPSFFKKYGLKGSVISAVDLIKGLGKIVGLEVINVSGATGYYDTNYEGKARAALNSLKDKDFVFIHIEAPDEAGHNGDLREKVAAIERIDQFIVGAVLETFKGRDDFRVMVLPDHATPLAVKTHTPEPIPFAIFGKGFAPSNSAGYSEKEAQESSLYFEEGWRLMDHFIKT